MQWLLRGGSLVCMWIGDRCHDTGELLFALFRRRAGKGGVVRHRIGAAIGLLLMALSAAGTVAALRAVWSVVL